ncbi:dipeptide epimerase [Pedobacter sp. HMF7647]|uniref:Dipeptide epimerase n=1 Tax=Hufsiella arboris TaxID=2695275 RepID=A0A7K1Y5P0_9SPHI|nr:dipeptide epimerase [Hufsiella arboris]
MQLSYKPFQLNLKYPFTIAKFSRTYTPIMLIELHYEGFTGLGEASMVPYMGEDYESAAAFLKKIDWSKIAYPFNYDEIRKYLGGLSAGLPAIKAAVDIALHDLEGKLTGTPCYKFFESEKLLMPETSVTIGIDVPEIIAQKLSDAGPAKIIKVKLGRDNDRELINTIRSITDKPLFVDANQGWTDKYEALDKVQWLAAKNVALIEQPMDKTNFEDNKWITERSPIAIIGDEAVQRLEDVDKAAGIYHGINVKLMKSAGMHEAYLMIKRAKELNLKILIGCMSETSIATMAAAALAPLCDWADLDGPFLTSNNPFPNPGFENGKWLLPDVPGLGVPEI